MQFFKISSKQNPPLPVVYCAAYSYFIYIRTSILQVLISNRYRNTYIRYFIYFVFIKLIACILRGIRTMHFSSLFYFLTLIVSA